MSIRCPPIYRLTYHFFIVIFFPYCESACCDSAHKCCGAFWNALLSFGVDEASSNSGKICPCMPQQYHVTYLNLLLCVKLAYNSSSVFLYFFSSILSGLSKLSCFEILRSVFWLLNHPADYFSSCLWPILFPWGIDYFNLILACRFIL